VLFHKGKEGTKESPLFLLCSYFLRRGKLSLFQGERAKGKGEIFCEILHFWENFLGSGIASYKAIFPDEKVFDPRSACDLRMCRWLPPGVIWQDFTVSSISMPR
jgi:hypothetical protein